MNHTPQPGDLYRVKKNGNTRRVVGIFHSWAGASVSWERVGAGTGPLSGRCGLDYLTHIAEHVGVDNQENHR